MVNWLTWMGWLARMTSGSGDSSKVWAMLRLLARDSGGLSLVPEVVVQDELLSGKLKKYYVLKNVTERFFAITAKRHFELVALRTLLEKSQESVMAAGLRVAG